MQLRVTGAAGAMPKLRGHKPCALHAHRAELFRAFMFHVSPIRPATHMAGLAFQPGQRLSHRRFAGVENLLLHQRVAERVHHRHRFRHREREIEPGYPASVRTQPFTIRGQPRARQQPSEHGLQIIARHDTVGVETQALGGVAGPGTCRFALARVVVIETGRDLREVIRLGAHTQFPQRHHISIELRSCSAKHVHAPGAGV